MNTSNPVHASSEKTVSRIANLIILDRSGSMDSIRRQAIDGVNETLGTIRSAQRTTGLRHTVTLCSFCACEMRDTYVDIPAEEARNFTPDDYVPCCCTPLYDAIGRCCTQLKTRLGADAATTAVSVTIITDGYENASREWTEASVGSLIKSLQAEGWLFAYIGANQDTAKVSYNLNIRNHCSFTADADGTAAMFARERASREKWARNFEAPVSCADLSSINGDYFDVTD